MPSKMSHFLRKISFWISKKSTWKWILAILFLAAPLLIYVFKFGTYSISNDPADWALFGNYIGGIYTVLVTLFAIYLTRHLDKRDVEKKKAKIAIGELYEQICKIDYQQIDMRSVKRLLRLTHEYELYIPNDVYTKLTELYDDYVVAKDNPESFQLQKEVQLKSRLKKLYDS